VLVADDDPTVALLIGAALPRRLLDRLAGRGD
jgi:hypothetical protein